MPGIASSAPAVLIGHIADATTTIRVGSGGVMLPNHAPLVVAEQFGMLEALHPGRIDLGIGRAPGTDQVTAAALRRSPRVCRPTTSPTQLRRAARLLRPAVSRRITRPRRSPRCPAAGYQPAMWLLGSSDYSAQVAGLLGLPFSFAHHFSAGQHAARAGRSTASTSGPSELLDHPYAMVGGGGGVRRDRRAGPLAGRVRARCPSCGCARAVPGRCPTPEEAAAHPYTALERAFVEDRQASQIVGAPETVSRRDRPSWSPRPPPTS